MKSMPSAVIPQSELSSCRTYPFALRYHKAKFGIHVGKPCAFPDRGTDRPGLSWLARSGLFEKRQHAEAPVHFSFESVDEILELENRQGRLFLDHAGAVVPGALLRIREYLVSTLEMDEGLRIPRPRVVGMKPGRHDAEDPMNGFHVRVAADLQDFRNNRFRASSIPSLLTRVHYGDPYV